MKKGRHGRSLLQILVLVKASELQKNVLNNLFVNKEISLTNQALLTTASICIYILRLRIEKFTHNDLTAKISFLRCSHLWIDICIPDCCNNGQVCPYHLNVNRYLHTLNGLVGGIVWDYLAYPSPIYFGTDESFTWFWFHNFWISFWHMKNPQLVVECFETFLLLNILTP